MPQPGQAVVQGAVIGEMGGSGGVEAPHLHFEVRKDGTAIAPVIGGAVMAKRMTLSDPTQTYASLADRDKMPKLHNQNVMNPAENKSSPGFKKTTPPHHHVHG